MNRLWKQQAYAISSVFQQLKKTNKFRNRGYMKKNHNKVTHEQIRIALEQFYSQGGQIQVLPPQNVDLLYSKIYAEILAEVESIYEVTNLPKDLEFYAQKFFIHETPAWLVGNFVKNLSRFSNVRELSNLLVRAVTDKFCSLLRLF